MGDSEGLLWIGQLNCEDGRWKSVPPTCDQDCFSPTNSPQLAFQPSSAGCSCDAEPPECVLTEHDGEPRRLSLYCEEGRWVSAKDGVCGDGGQADCRVQGATYPHGARRVLSPSDCNDCECNDGQLICNEVNCPDDDLGCPEGTSLISRCVKCSVGEAMSQCSVVETGCFTEEECPGGMCGIGCI